MAPSAPAKKAAGPKNVQKVVTAKVTSAKKAVLARKGVVVKKAAPVNQDNSREAILERRKALPPMRKSQLRKTKYDIRVIKRVGGATRFVKKLRSLRNAQYKKVSEKRRIEGIRMKKAAMQAIKEKAHAKAKKTGKPLQIHKKQYNYSVKKMRKSYDTQLAPRKLHSSNTFRDMNFKSRPQVAKLRKNLTPGTVCILLAGKYKGCKVVYLKQLRRSGLCLVSGPLKLSKVPLRRMNQNYMIATSVKIDLSEAKMPKINDFYFRRQKTPVQKKEKKSGTDEDVFAPKKTGRVRPSAQRKEDQKKVDREIVAAIKAGENKKMVMKYISTKFSVMGRRYPHAINF